MMWTFSVKDVAQYFGAHMVRCLFLYHFSFFIDLFYIHHLQIQLWMTPTEQQTDREESLTQLCLQMSDDGFLIFAIFVSFLLLFFFRVMNNK